MPTPKRKHDNSTFARKASLRHEIRKHLPEPLTILETHGGVGHLFEACYAGVTDGLVFEINPQRTPVLAQQRPTWRVYEMDAERGLALGLGAELTVNLLDLDPWGDPWPYLLQFFRVERARPDVLGVVVNDGLRNKIRLGGAWTVGSIAPMVARSGHALFERYLAACQWYMEQLAAEVGYDLGRWAGYYCGHNQDMTHYAAIFNRRGSGSDAAG